MVEVLGGIHNCCASHLTTVVVDEDVAHDGEDPALEVDVVNILGLIVKHFERCVLNEILSCFAVGSKLTGKTEQVALQSE